MKYYICANMTTVTPTDNSACSVDLYMNEGKCCPCTASPSHPGLDLRMNETRVTDNKGLGLSTGGCHFSTSTEQRLLFFARHTLAHSQPPVYQLIGITDVKKKLEPIPSASSVSESTVIGSTVGVIVAVVFGILFCVFAVGVGYKFGKKHKGQGYDRLDCKLILPL